jgi:hypothetical protein
MDISARYLFTCKDNYFAGIRPADSDSKNKDGCKSLIEIAQSYFAENKEEDFAGYFWEYQYCVNLWTAHLILEYGQPDKKLIEKSLEIIERYSDSELDPELASQEKSWLDKYRSKYMT